MTTLATLNTLRAANGKAPLKAWKESKTKLLAAIEKEGLTAAPAKKPTPNLAVSQYFKEKNLNPKVARAKLRRAGLSAPYTLAQVKKVLG